VQVISRVAQIFRALDGEPQGLSLAQLAAQLSLPRSTVHRIVSALIAEGFLATASPNGRVRIGPEFTRLAASNRVEAWEQAEPYLQRIYDELGETVDCSVLHGDRVRVVRVLPARHELRAVAEVGATFPLHCSSKGRAILAELDNETAARLLPPVLDRYTAKTPTTVPAVLAILDGVRRTGVAYDREEATTGICAAAIALREPAGSLLAISVPVPISRYDEEKITSVLREVRDQARKSFETAGALARGQG
jgi:DNA-binding IclR family transcriptional regulator